MRLIIISGAEATGKSTIGRLIAKELGYTYLAKDVIKEHLFDTEQVSTWNYGWYEAKAKKQFFKDIQKHIAAGKSLVLESNFIGKDRARLLEIILDQAESIKEVHCCTSGFTSFRRFVKRNETKVRHPGHHDRRWYVPVLANTITGNLKIYDAHAAVRLTDEILFVDTTDFNNLNLLAVINFVRANGRHTVQER